MVSGDDVQPQEGRKPFIVDAAAYFDPTRSRYSYHLLDVAETEAPPEIKRALKLVDERVVLRHRLMLHDNDPVELSWSYYPSSIADGTELTQRRRIVGGAPRILADAGFPMAEFSDRVSARMPTPQEAELLALPPNVPVIRQLRVVMARDERPVEASVLVKGGHLHELRYRQSTNFDGRAR